METDIINVLSKRTYIQKKYQNLREKVGHLNLEQIKKFLPNDISLEEEKIITERILNPYPKHLNILANELGISQDEAGKKEEEFYSQISRKLGYIFGEKMREKYSQRYTEAKVFLQQHKYIYDILCRDNVIKEILNERIMAENTVFSTLKEIGDVYEITRERVRQVETILLDIVDSYKGKTLEEREKKYIENFCSTHNHFLLPEEEKEFFIRLLKESKSDLRTAHAKILHPENHVAFGILLKTLREYGLIDSRRNVILPDYK